MRIQTTKAPSATRGEIADSIRQQIVAGRLKPGTQLPTRAQIEKEHGASPATVQHAFDLLQRDGFIQVHGRQGTYVVDYPPHLYHYAMVFHQHLSGHTDNRLFQAMIRTAGRYDGTQPEPRRIATQHGVEDHVDNQQMRKLRHAVRNRSLAGLIFPENPFSTGLASSYLGLAPAMPRVSLLAAPTETFAAVAFEPMISKALDYLAQVGCRRVAVLSNLCDETSAEWLTSAIQQRGMTTRPYWIQAVHLMAPMAARRVVNLLFHGGQDERPDGFLITDDNLVEYAIGGLVDAAVQVPSELRVVAHCNFPVTAPTVLPVKRLGYRISDVMDACLELLAEQGQGKPPGLRLVNAVFEDEPTVPIGSRAMEPYARAALPAAGAGPGS